MSREGQSPLRQWFRQASADERQRMADLVFISVSYARALAYGYRHRSLSLSLRMAHAARVIRAEGGADAEKRLPDVQRGDVSPRCAECPFYKLCRAEGITENNN